VLASHEAASAVVVVVGPREAASETVSLRDGAHQRSLPLARAISEIARASALPI